MSIVHLHLDFETRSKLDIKRVGLDRYAKSAQILMMAWAVNDQPPQLWLPSEGPLPDQVGMMLANPAAALVYRKIQSLEFGPSQLQNALEDVMTNELKIQKAAKATMTYIEQVAAKHGIDLQAEARKSEEVERVLAELRNRREFDRINHGPFQHPVSKPSCCEGKQFHSSNCPNVR